MEQYENELTRINQVRDRWSEVDVDRLLQDEIVAVVRSMTVEQKVMLKCLAKDLIGRKDVT